ncbi:helix-turn-helix domain-containing protein [Streptomyces poriferorum]|uniref:helix-turn-helix domain-containing protein n=1 Tax=Streptomyces poriferorum TaxID=2798799 RepID=UPI00353272AE
MGAGCPWCGPNGCWIRTKGGRHGRGCGVRSAEPCSQPRSASSTVRTWRGRFAYGGIRALTDHRRSGRAAWFTPEQVAEVKARRPRP